jgi:MFS family permease
LGYFVGSFQIDAVGGWRYMFGVSAPVALIMGLGCGVFHHLHAGYFLGPYKVKALYKITKRRPLLP